MSLGERDRFTLRRRENLGLQRDARCRAHELVPHNVLKGALVHARDIGHATGNSRLALASAEERVDDRIGIE